MRLFISVALYVAVTSTFASLLLAWVPNFQPERKNFWQRCAYFFWRYGLPCAWLLGALTYLVYGQRAFNY